MLPFEIRFEETLELKQPRSLIPLDSVVFTQIDRPSSIYTVKALVGQELALPPLPLLFLLLSLFLVLHDRWLDNINNKSILLQLIVKYIEQLL